MKRRLVVGIGLGLAISAVASCSSGSSSASGDVCQRIVSTELDFLVRCSATGALYDDPAVRSLYSDSELASCRKLMAAPGNENFASQYNACLDAVGQPACRGAGLTPAACAIVGTLADGASCLEGVQCTSGTCITTSTSTSTDGGPPAEVATKCGTCAPTLGEGAPCKDASAQCKSGFGCDGASGTCIRPVGVDAGAVCDGAHRCNAGLFCGHDGKCAPLGGKGATCTNEDDCAQGLTCNGSCIDPPVAGGSCKTSGGSAPSPKCGGSSVCTGETCSAAAIAQPGAACDAAPTSGQPLRVCLIGSCNRDTKLCPPLLADGAACNTEDSSAGACGITSKCIGGTCQAEDPSVCR